MNLFLSMYEFLIPYSLQEELLKQTFSWCYHALNRVVFRIHRNLLKTPKYLNICTFRVSALQLGVMLARANIKKHSVTSSRKLTNAKRLNNFSFALYKSANYFILITVVVLLTLYLFFNLSSRKKRLR